jgi:transcription elongation factor Elf1
MHQNMFCPVCGAEHLIQFTANKPVADFYCDNCRQEYELKSKVALSIGKNSSAAPGFKRQRLYRFY